jgi:hypothetical protein
MRDLKLITFRTGVVDNGTRVTYIYLITYCMSVYDNGTRVTYIYLITYCMSVYVFYQFYGVITTLESNTRL